VVEGVISPADALRAWRYQKQRLFLLSRAAGALGVGGTAVLTSVTGAFQPVLLPGVVFFLLPRLTTRSAKKMLLENRRLFGPHVLTVSDQGIHARNDQGEEQLAWGRVRRFVETEEDFILSLGGSRIVAFPKHLFGGDVAEARARIASGAATARR
jgi:hypothetical protein